MALVDGELAGGKTTFWVNRGAGTAAMSLGLTGKASYRALSWHTAKWRGYNTVTEVALSPQHPYSATGFSLMSV